MRSILHPFAIAVLSVMALATSCTKVEQVVNPYTGPGGLPGPDRGNIVGRVSPAGSRAVVVAAQAAPVDSTPIDPGDGSFVLAGLPPGTYDVSVRADDYRIESLERVAVYAGSVSYVGRIELSSTPDMIRSFAPDRNSEVVLGSSQGTRLSIGINFEVPMDRASVQAAFTTDPPTEGVFYWSQSLPKNYYDYTGSYPYDSAPAGYREVVSAGELTTYRNIRSLRFVPRGRDTFVDATYRVMLSTAARDSAGNRMRFPLAFSFATIQGSTTLTRIQTQPEDGARGVDPLNQSVIRVTFPKKMDHASVEAALTMEPSSTPIFLWPAENQLILYVGGPLRTGAHYVVRIGVGAMDLDGVPLPEPFEFSFETQPVSIRYVSPPNGTVFVDFSPQLRITLSFNTYIVRSTFAPAFSISPPVAGELLWESNNNVTFRPGERLGSNTKYTVTVANTFQDLHGSTMPSPYSFAFVTRPE
jgi:hypothetical protein